MKIHSSIRRARSGEQGWILLALLLIIALMAIATGAIVSSISFEIKRDREEEMIHRGVQYSRAIKAYYKKFNRYPAKIEDLENTNQMRFLRKRYKDPLTGKDFKLLHFGEAKLSGNGLGGGVIPGAATLGANGALNAPGGLGQPSTFGQPSTLGGSSGLGLNSQPQGTNPNPNDPTLQSSEIKPSDGSSPDASTPTGPGSPSGSSGDKLSNTTFGGAPIVGVASTSKDRTIREFDKKKKYDEWQFVYDPTFDRGFLITTPYQPSLQGFGVQGNINGLNNNPGQNGMNNGFGNTFGNSPGGLGGNQGMQNQPSPQPNQPSNPPQQQ